MQVSDILPLSLTLVVAGIGIAFGLSVLADTKDDVGDSYCDDQGGYWNSDTDVCQVSSTNTTTLAANPAQVNATADTITGVSKFSSKMGLIATEQDRNTLSCVVSS